MKLLIKRKNKIFLISLVKIVEIEKVFVRPPGGIGSNVQSTHSGNIFKKNAQKHFFLKIRKNNFLHKKRVKNHIFFGIYQIFDESTFFS